MDLASESSATLNAFDAKVEIAIQATKKAASSEQHTDKANQDPMKELRSYYASLEQCARQLEDHSLYAADRVARSLQV